MPTASKEYQLTLCAHDVGQLLDGLRLRCETWAKPAAYLESGFNPDDAFICEECSDPHEARRIAQHYDQIVANIEAQVKKQGGWQ